MTSEAGEDVWGDEDFLNALILATENASAASSSSAGASLPLPGSNVRRSQGNGIPASSTDHAMASTSRHSPFDQLFSGSLLPPPPRPVRVAPRAPPSVSLASNGTQAPWQEWDDFFADGNLELFDVGFDSRACNFSPPRELSQRVKKTESNFVANDQRKNKPSSPKNFCHEIHSLRRSRVEKDKDKEIERMKREMDKLSKKLDSMERERFELQDDRSRKDKELERAFSEILAKSVEIESLKKEIFCEPPIKEDHHMKHVSEQQLCDVPCEPIAPLSDPSLEQHFPEDCIKKRKNIQSEKPSLVSDLQDCVINNGALNSSERFIQVEYHPKENIHLQHSKTIGIQTELDGSDLASGALRQIPSLSDKLLSIWGPTTKRKSGRYFISRLLGCCSEDLCILIRFTGVPSNEVVLDDLKCSIQSVEAQKISQLYSILMKIRDEILHLDDLLEALTDLCALGNVIIAYRSLRILRALLQIICPNQSIQRNNIIIHPSGAVDMPSRSYLSSKSWFSLFESMHGVILRYSKTVVLVEAISIMNLILQNSHPISEREKLGLIPSFESVSYLLSKEVDFAAKRQAVKHLFLLLNCPNHLKVFSNCCNEIIGLVESARHDSEASRLHQSIKSVIKGLADCIDHRVSGTQDLLLCREVVILLAFLASSGKSGFNILLNPIPKRENFLRLIIEVLVYQMELSGSCESQDLQKERAALTRESLILLNRLSSNKAYSKATLGALTQSTATSALTIDFLMRVSHKMGGDSNQDGIKKAPMEAEIADLARLFRSRLLSFLGEDPS